MGCFVHWGEPLKPPLASQVSIYIFTHIYLHIYTGHTPLAVFFLMSLTILRRVAVGLGATQTTSRVSGEDIYIHTHIHAHTHTFI